MPSGITVTAGNEFDSLWLVKGTIVEESSLTPSPMAPVTNPRVLFAKIPKDFPVPGETTVYDTTQTIDLESVPLNGGFLLKTLVLSIDPYMRGRMREPEIESYMPAYPLGEPPYEPRLAVGKYVYGIIPHQAYNVTPSMEGLIFLEKNPMLPWTVFLGAAGMPGLTAYCGWKEFSKAKKGETAFVTTGAGPVGSMVIQLAKRDGLKVIASAGSDAKVEFMKEIGADVAFNYKTTNTRDVLAREGPIDVFWDNVGGEMLEAALDHANINGRFLECGFISAYNTDEQGIKNFGQVFGKSLQIFGILVLRLGQKYATEFYQEIPSAIASGELKYSEDASHGLGTVGDVILRVQKGWNNGKTVVIVADE
ncbi:NAD P-binding protein [Mycena sanguinolenta]|uniref:NAD P-binding protein n=1 Tax=Mycena sanguinolenta TaxID=230812 RepID=A0A8H6XRH8_9AGAR|nr:NAD P-binding protein [Mycena sanguinolenta]